VYSAELTPDRIEGSSSEAPEASLGSTTNPLPDLLGRAALMTPIVALPSVVLGNLVAFAQSGSAAVVFRSASTNGPIQCEARSTVELDEHHLGGLVVLVFEDGDENRPIIIGVVRQSTARSDAKTQPTVQLDVDRDRLTVTATDQLVLRCGKASLSMTKEGKVVIYGTYISSRSTGVHRIKGGSVEIN
jgi:hypothetical protein